MSGDFDPTEWITTTEAAASGCRGSCSVWMVEEIEQHAPRGERSSISIPLTIGLQTSYVANWEFHKEGKNGNEYDRRKAKAAFSVP